MIDFHKIIHSKLGKTLISIILGLGLASLFRHACHEKKCLRFVGPEYEKISEKTYEFNGKCYRFKPRAVSKNENKKQVEFA